MDDADEILTQEGSIFSSFNTSESSNTIPSTLDSPNNCHANSTPPTIIEQNSKSKSSLTDLTSTHPTSTENNSKNLTLDLNSSLALSSQSLPSPNITLPSPDDAPVYPDQVLPTPEFLASKPNFSSSVRHGTCNTTLQSNTSHSTLHTVQELISGLSAPQDSHRIRKCLKLMGRKIVCDLVRTIYSHDEGSNGGKMTLEEFCVKDKICPLTSQQHLIKANLNETDFNILFGYEVLTMICTKLYQKLSEGCRRDVRKLCEIVSEAALTQLNQSDSDLSPFLDHIRRLQDSIYKSVGQLVEKDLCYLKEETEQLVNNLLEADINEDMVSEMSCPEINMYRKLRMTVKGYQTLAEHYEKLGDLTPSMWKRIEEGENTAESSTPFLLKVEDIFTEPLIKEGEKVIGVKKLLSTGGCLLIHGLAGSGKTSLCQYLIQDWLNGGINVEGLANVHLIFFIEICGVQSTCLREYLLDQVLPMYCAGFDPDLIIPTLKELNILFIIDGFDQTTRESLDLLEDVFAKFGEKKIIMTMRPELYRDAICLTARHRVQPRSLQLIGFVDDMHEQLCCKMFKVMVRDKATRQRRRRAFVEYTRDRQKILEQFVQMPFTAVLLVLLWIKNPKVFNTATQLYQEMSIQLTRKLCERLSRDVVGVSDTPEMLSSLKLSLGAQAWDLLKQGSLTIPLPIQKKLEAECEEKGIEAMQFLSGFHLCHIHDDPGEWRLKLAFLNGSQARYLAAAFLSRCVQAKSMKIHDIGAQGETCPELSELLMFFTGHMALQDNLTSSVVNDVFSLMKKISVDHSEFCFWWNLFEESRYMPQVGTLVAQEILHHKHWELNQTNAADALRLLSFTPVKVRSLSLDVPKDVEPYDIPNLLEILQGLDQHLKRRQKKLIRVDMHLLRHEKSNVNETSDDFLWALGCWGDLLSFVGSLGEHPEGEELLAAFPNLKSARIKVSTAGAFRSMSIGLRKIYKSVRSLVVTLDLKVEVGLEAFSELRHNGTLEVCVLGMKDTQKEWLVEVVKIVGGRGGCWRLRLEECHMTYDALEWVVRQLRGHVRNKIDIETME